MNRRNFLKTTSLGAIFAGATLNPLKILISRHPEYYGAIQYSYFKRGPETIGFSFRTDYFDSENLLNNEALTATIDDDILKIHTKKDVWITNVSWGKNRKSIYNLAKNVNPFESSLKFNSGTALSRHVKPQNII